MSNLTKYSLDHEVRSSFEMGQLIPFLCQEVVPGDKYRVQSSTLVRLQPMLSPLMHRLDYYQRYYYVPYRLLIPNYEKLLTDPDSGQVVPAMDSYLKYTSKTMSELFLEKPLLEYFGLATSNGDVNPANVLKDINATPLLAYYLIYNHYYMRSDIDSRYIDQLMPENFASAELKKYIGNIMYVNEGLDYFTGAKTSTQYGNMVQLDMDGNNTITVPEMRLAERLQSFRERLLRVGGKYVNYIKEFFGVEPLDARVQIPKYLGGDSYVLNVSDVDQTSPSELGSVGESYGKSVSVNRTGQIEYDVYEHGLIIGLHFVRPRPSNIGGCPKLFTRRTYFDFFNPHFSALGYQEIESRELDITRSKNETFGYVPRYDEYRYGNDLVSGDFRRSLNFWHLSRDITKEQLSVDFLTCHPDTRIFSYTGESRLYLYQFSGMATNFLPYGSAQASTKIIPISGLMWAPLNFKDPKGAVFHASILSSDLSHMSMTYDISIARVKLVSTDIESGKHYIFDVDSYDEDVTVDNITVTNKVFYSYGLIGHDADMVLLNSVTEPTFRFGIDPNKQLSKDIYRLSEISNLSRDGVSYPFLIDMHQDLLESIDSRYFVLRNWFFFDMVNRNIDKPVDNHVLSVTYNNVDVLRPLARYDGNVLR